MLRRRTPLKSNVHLRSHKRMNAVGRVGKYRAERKKQWIKDHPPYPGGWYICWICRHPVHIDVMKLDHVLPKGSTPKAIAEADENLLPSHKKCNDEKGSKRYG